MQLIDSFLNRITMYRLTLYYLIGLILAAIILSFFGILHNNPLDIAINTLLVVIVCWASNLVLAKLFGAVTNSESALITALILALIIPIKFPVNTMFFIGAGIVAMGSKYFVTIEKRHVFNPAAASVLALSLLSPEHSAVWWVGTQAMLPFVFIGGFLLVRKIQRGVLVMTFMSIYLLLISIAAIIHGGSFDAITSTWKLSILNSAFFFFAFVMLTEPLTSPPTKKLRKYFAALVAIFYATPQLRLFSIAVTPEMALCIGNVFSYIVSPKFRLELSLAWKQAIGTNTVVLGFNPVKNFNFIPGQYMEWTLPHKNTDSRGNRRYFSIASSPNENSIILMVKFYSPSSSFKKELLTMDTGNKIIAASLAGDFVLPKNLQMPIVFIAGGVGVAPFRSMIEYLVENKLQSNIVLIYSNKTIDEIAFADLFTLAEQYGVKTVYTLTDVANIPQNWTGGQGRVSADLIKANIPDFLARTYYLSGPQNMVDAYKELLKDIDVDSKKIKTDYFPGY